jgi:hypothetical protein
VHRDLFCTVLRWPRHRFCDEEVLLLVDYAYDDRFAWSPSPNASSPGAANETDSANSPSQARQQQQLPEALTQRLGPGYSDVLPVRYINSTFICQQPSVVCASTPVNGTQSACLLAEYAKLDPDAAAGVEAAGDPGRNYGLSVVLPAVLVSVREWPQRPLPPNLFQLQGY